jgi:hypothetical protein
VTNQRSQMGRGENKPFKNGYFAIRVRNNKKDKKIEVKGGRV